MQRIGGRWTGKMAGTTGWCRWVPGTGCCCWAPNPIIRTDPVLVFQPSDTRDHKVNAVRDVLRYPGLKTSAECGDAAFDAICEAFSTTLDDLSDNHESLLGR